MTIELAEEIEQDTGNPEDNIPHTYCPSCSAGKRHERVTLIAVCGYVRKPRPGTRTRDNLCAMCVEALADGPIPCPMCGLPVYWVP